MGWTIALAMACGAFEPFYLRVFTLHRAGFGAMLTELPYRKLPGSREFLLEVRRRTADGDAIAIFAMLHRAPRWEGGYDYLYSRAPYLLAGRRVVPLIGPDDRFLAGNIALAQYIAAYRSSPRPPGFEVVWRGRDGELLRRTQ